MDQQTTVRPLEYIQSLLADKDRTGLARYVDSLTTNELVYLMNKLERKEQQQLLMLIHPEEAADVIEELPEVQAVDIIEHMDAGNAASIVDSMTSDERADLIMELDNADAEAILTVMNPENAASTRKLIEYDPETAGGLMSTECFSFSATTRVDEVVEHLRRNIETYKHYYIRYIYVVSDRDEFLGVLQLHDLLLADQKKRLADIAVTDVVVVKAYDPLDKLKDLFDTYDFYGFPVLDEHNKLIGVLSRRNVMEALNERSAYDHLESQGIVGGDELRSMPVILRSKRRLAWLSVNVLLNLVAASVIAFYQDTLSAVIALAVFLPIISDMSGCTGNQAVAVSMRELSIGTVRPNEVLRVWWQEVSVGLINGLVLGLLIGIAAFLWKGNLFFGLVVGLALGINTLIAVSLGGTIPLILKKAKIDPALASGPILTTVTDMVGFFLTLAFATLALSRISGL